MKKLMTAFLSMLLAISVCVHGNAIIVSADSEYDVNFALNKTVVASAEHSALPARYLTDADEDSRWSTELAPTQWAYIDLGAEYEVNTFQMIWESDSVYAAAYTIYVSNDVNDWGTPVVQRNDNKTKLTKVVANDSVRGRYVKLEINEVKGYPSVSCRDFKVMLSDEQAQQDPFENVARGKNVVAKQSEVAQFGADKAVDGDTTSRASRWASTTKPTWIYVDLEKTMDIKTIILFWERRNATSYDIQVADTLSSPMVESDWKTVKSFNEVPTTKGQKIIFDSVEKARYARLSINDYLSADLDGIDNFPSVSIYEMEIYGGNPKNSIDDVLNAITLENPAKGTQKLDISTIANYEDYLIEYNGTDYEQVIDQDLTIYQPLVDTSVKVSFKVTDKESQNYKFKEVNIVVPGISTVEASDNKAPAILPELREWKGAEGFLTIKDQARIIVENETLIPMAETFKGDFKEITGKDLIVEIGNKAAVETGDFYFALTSDVSKGLKEEGYLLTVEDRVYVEAETETGAYWATRTILQALQQGNNTMPKGMSRDYPLYKVRGFILDVARKGFTMDFLKQVTKEMSWYKLNDFQIHLNDNYIFLEEYTNMGLDPMQAYSAFRLESDIKKGGMNQQDLTSEDLFYTKKEFKEYIKESRVRGINIVPEIDTPAHSLALTKVRPDLRVGTSGRDNDHLNLTTMYDESVGFVKSIFDDYLLGDDPVFDSQTIIHIGADEYNASSTAYRRFSNDMINYVKNKNRIPRIWGSLSAAKEGEEVRGEGVQINLWNFGYANMDKMYDLGFDLINCNDGQYYIVPNAGYYGDYLSNNTMYNRDINTISGITIPAGDKQMVGGAFAVWNDMVDRRNNGISEYDVYDRIKSGIPLLAANLWGKKDFQMNDAITIANSLGNAPGTNFTYEVASKSENIAQYNLDSLNDVSGNAYDLVKGKNASIKEVDYKKALQLKGGESYVTSPIETAGLDNSLRVKVKRTSASRDEQILFESPYGAIKAVQKDTGNVGISRELFDYSFNYELPINEWVELEFKNVLNRTSLYVNGILVDTLGDGESVLGRPLVATNMLPMQRIGSETNAFVGYVDDIRLAKEGTYASTMPLEYAVWSARAYLSTNENEGLNGLVAEAMDTLKAFQPDAEVITALSTEINDLLKALDYKKADYEELKIYIDLIAKDLSYFTKESVAQLTHALNSVRYDLINNLQGVVDEYTSALGKALDNLTIREIKSVTEVDSSKIEMSASSYQGDGSGPDKVLDGDLTTLWHTDWSITRLPHWINFEMNEVTKVNGISYTPRSGAGNGTILAYTIQISDDGVNYTDIKSGTWAQNATVKEVMFDSVSTKHIRLVVTKSVGNFGAAAEMRLFAADVKADVDGLSNMIEEVENLVDKGYTAATWDALHAIIEDAKQLVIQENADATEVEVMKATVSKAMMSLRLVSTTKEDLDALYWEAMDVEVNAYTASSKETLQIAIKEAKVVLGNENASKKEVVKAYTSLQTAMIGLQEVASANEVASLKAMIKQVEELRDNYSEEEFAEAAKMLSEAEKILEKDVNEITQAEYFITWSGLVLAKNELSKIDISLKVLKKDLQTSIDLAQATLEQGTDNIRPGKVRALEEAVAKGKMLLDNNSSDKEAIKEATITIVKAAQELWEIVNNNKLKDLIVVAEKIDGNYTEASSEVLAKAIAEAKVVVANKDATTQEVQEATTNLSNAMKDLETVVSKKALEAQMKITENIIANKINYVTSSIGNIEAVYAEAQVVYTNEYATQTEIDASTVKLTAENMKARLKADMSALNETVERARNIDLSQYDEESANVLRNVLANATRVLGREEVTQIEVDMVRYTLENAIRGLRLIPASNLFVIPQEVVEQEIKAEETSQAQVEVEVSTKDKEKSEVKGDQTPKAGNSVKKKEINKVMPIAIGGAILVAIGGLLVILKKRREQE